MSSNRGLIENLKSKKWMFKGAPVSITAHNKIQDEYVFSLSNGEIVRCFEKNLKATLEANFRPLPTHKEPEQTPVKVGAFSETLVQLRDVLLDNIKKVQNSKDYVPQAKEINNSVKEVINLAKVDIEYARLSKELHP